MPAAVTLNPVRNYKVIRKKTRSFGGYCNPVEISNRVNAYRIAPSLLFEGNSLLNDEKIISLTNRRSALIVERKIEEKFKNHLDGIYKLKPKVVYFRGECSLDEVARITNLLGGLNTETIVAIGGGKIIDTSKIVAQKLGSKLMTVPTSSATCAAFTSISPTYHQDGRKFKTINLKKAPDVCVIDYDILFNQPVRLFTSGITDALAKYYETAAFINSHPLFAESSFVLTAFMLSRAIRDDIFEFSESALSAIRLKKPNEEFKRLIYAAIVLTGLVSGIGGKGCRAVGAHALANGLTFNDFTKKSLHGHRVGWGLLVQSVLENKYEDFGELSMFYRRCRIPYSIRHLGLKNLTFNGLKEAMRVAVSPAESMRFLNRKVCIKELWKAIKIVEETKF